MEGITVTDVRYKKGDSAFLIDDKKTAILYDTGFGFTGYRIADNIKAVLGDRELDYIFLTHSHYDHALATPYISRMYPNAKVVAGEYAAEVFKRDGAKKKMKELDQSYAKKCNMDDYEFLGDELKVDITVKDGDIIKAGDMEFEVINLPGHTKCSVGFYLKEQGLLLATETLGIYDGESVIAPSFLVSYKDSIDSMDRVLKLDIKELLCPHWGLLSKESTKFFLENMKPSAEYFATEIKDRLQKGQSDEEIFEWLKAKLWNGYIKTIYPRDAFHLNSSLNIELVRKELL